MVRLGSAIAALLHFCLDGFHTALCQRDKNLLNNLTWFKRPIIYWMVRQQGVIYYMTVLETKMSPDESERL